MKLTGIGKYIFCTMPSTTFHPHKFQVDLMFDDPDEEAKARDLGLKIKPKDDNHEYPYHKFTSYTEVKEIVDGKEKFRTVDEYLLDTSHEKGRKPRVFDATAQPYRGVVGSGSRVAVIFDVWKNEASTKGLWRALQVLELVLPEGYTEDYVPGGSSESVESELEVDEKGFVAGKNTKSASKSTDKVDPELNDSLDDL